VKGGGKETGELVAIWLVEKVVELRAAAAFVPECRAAYLDVRLPVMHQKKGCRGAPALGGSDANGEIEAQAFIF
jgi:hypothetical protein